MGAVERETELARIGHDRVNCHKKFAMILERVRRGLGTLPYSRHFDMVFHMKTTLVIDDHIMKRLKIEAARQGKTISELVETALRQLLEAPRSKTTKLPPLPSYKLGGALVDIADRDALYQAMEGH